MFEGDGLLSVKNELLLARRPYILFMSRFDREKGGRELLRAFADIADDHPDLDLIMAGDGVDATFLQLEAENLGIKKRVLFPGYVQGADKWRLLRDCILFALPTYYRSEGMPVAVLEAMGAGKPLLVGGVGAMRSIASEPENGIVLNDITAKSIEVGLRRLLGNPDLMKTMAKHNAILAWDQYEAQSITEKIEDFYHQVARC